ncbi:MAG: FGGY-family carbohydrate kinase [Anaerolineae bacterium]|nr:FGGY-family carbohydrate kinase [Anaerolineae bacterium]
MSTQYIIAHDVGTSGNKAVLVDTGGDIRASAFQPYPVHYPRPDWAEQEPEDWWKTIVATTRHVLAQSGVPPQDVLAMVYTTQMLGIVPMGRVGAGLVPAHEPLRPAIIWLDGRAPGQAERIMRKFLGRRVFAVVAGAELSGKDGLPKLLWLKENEPEVYSEMTCFLDVNGYLTYRATGRMVFEWSCASAFGFDLKKKDWLQGIIRYIGLDLDKFPPLVRSIDQVGGLTAAAARECGLLEGTPVFGGSGDAQSAAVGSGAVGEGEGHIYLGTSGWVGVVTEKTPTGRHGIASIQSADPDKAFLFAEMETAGACLKWIADEFYQAEQADPNVSNVYVLMDEKVETIPPGSDFLVFTPWMYGERAPVADTWVRSTFFNLSADHTREHLLRAVYEGVAYNLRWIVEIVEHTFGFPLPTLRVIGGGARGAPWMQIVADVTGRRVETVANPQEAGAVGAALTAAVGLGLYSGFEALKKVVYVEREFEPQAGNAKVYDVLYRAYHRIYDSLRGLYREVNEVRFREFQE